MSQVLLDDRSRTILLETVNDFVATAEPVGSRTLSKKLSKRLSPATIRNVMADLEELGYLYAHICGSRSNGPGLSVFRQPNPQRAETGTSRTVRQRSPILPQHRDIGRSVGFRL
jgi:hypothetical protein